jgi:uncharacterized protein (DUF1800 family)
MNLSAFQIVHLYNRAGFGINLEEFQLVKHKNVNEIVNNIFEKAKYYKPLTISFPSEIQTKKFAEMNEEEKKEVIKLSKEGVRTLNLTWLNEMSNSSAFMREKMAFFWHDHFACGDNNPVFMTSYCNVLRENALGNFRDLLFGVSKCAAMIKYLNNKQNKKDSPNENFAREVMELFTIGKGNYTEKDIKEAARAFTGWSFEPGNPDFKFRPLLHDYDEKECLGKKGNFDGDDILNILLERKETAKFIVSKIYAFFVNPKLDESRINELSDLFYGSKYDIGKLMEAIFNSDWFYEDKNIAQLIKSPIELLVSYNRKFEIKYLNENAQLFVQKALGQILLMPPNVGGWSNGVQWIDSSAILFRFNLPQILMGNLLSNVELKDSGDDNDELKQLKNEMVKTEIDWKVIASKVKFEKLNDIQGELEDFLFSKPPKSLDLDFFIKSTQKADLVKEIALRLIQLPEYQLN